MLFDAAWHTEKIRLIAFDLDGTLLDTLGDLTDSVNDMLREFSCPERSLEEIRLFVGNGMKNLVERSVPEDFDKNKTSWMLDFSTHAVEITEE